MITPDTPIEQMPKVSHAIMPSLKRLGIHAVKDFLMHIPSRYEDFSNKKKIADVISGDMLTVQGTIRSISRFRTKTSGAMLISASIADDTGIIQAAWFNQPYLLRTLAVGNIVNLSGKAELRSNGMTLQNPSYEKIPSQGALQSWFPIHTARFVPMYPETRGITSRWLRYLISSCIALRDQMEDPLPLSIRKEFNIEELKDAIYHLHTPRNHDDAHHAMRRFEFEHLLFIQLYSLRERMMMKQNKAPVIANDIALMKQFVDSLSFRLTNAQRKSIWEIMKDMEKPIPMNRLLQGDVGSGKTVVAAAALLLAAAAGKRGCLLAPTEILAKQHAKTLSALLNPFDISVGVYTASEKRTGSHHVVFVGTHALLQKNIRIKDLSLVIVDEQHRFGVQQRAALLRHHRTADIHPHFLSMTATPIPRTLALTIYGDLDISVLNEMPKNRKVIITQVVDARARSRAYEHIRQEVKQGRQVFVICPRIEVADDAGMPKTGKKVQASLLASEVKTVVAEHEKLSRTVFSDFNVAMLHGKMKARDKDRIMGDFRDHKIDVLVSTSVIEVGVDVPNASVMMIEGAERFGLAQLHQFRGRVGRGSEQSYCFLFPSEHGMAGGRLHALTHATNGFELAEIDLKLRGPGEFLGTKQWGISSIGMAALTNSSLVQDVRKAAKDILHKDPDLHAHPLIREKINAMKQVVHDE